MSTEGYDSSKSGFDNAKDSAKEGFDNAKETFNDAANNAKESAKDFQQNFNQTLNNQENKKVLAGIMGILLGTFGIHKFILGYNQEGIIQLILGIVSCGALGIIGLIEGIIYLTKSDEEFYYTYQVNKKGWF
ncbi:TM2 domain-containing protein [Nonlabens sp. Ci31]|uniref:TM2 domain-containing protein n=1 Tax=Nonlabens sp. Ci31 TaxID=2608253 RepID=UPI00146313AD|nr:TM2 domain-containing protein [Nonlabens sp. Ci31]QJP34125.1 TM2 domain-containing protein [Nonlabens sp. Ci31]